MADTDNYTSSLLAPDFDLKGYVPAGLNENLYMLTKNKPENQKKREDGRVYGADVFWKFTGHDNIGELNNPSAVAATKARQCTVEMLEDGAVGCILAVPRTYGSYNGTFENINNYRRPEWNPYIRRVEEESEGVGYTYLFVFNTTNSNAGSSTLFHVKRNQDPQFSSGVTAVRRDVRYSITKDISGIYPYGPEIGGSTVQDPDTEIGSLDSNESVWRWCGSQDTAIVRFATKNNSGEWRIDIGDYMQKLAENYAWGLYRSSKPKSETPYPAWMYTDATKNKMVSSTETAIENWPDIVQTLFLTELNQFAMQIGAYIQTGFPVFTVDRMDEMWKYFAGEDWESENDIDYPPSDWSTDWDIYIKGAQRPDIYITMKSDKVDQWLENLDENKSGTTKSEISVEYRYPQYTVEGASWSEPVNYSSTYTLVEWTGDSYNNTRSTSYNSNVEMNYPLLLSEVMMGEFTDGMIDSLYPWYAQMQFRIVYGKYKSAWCGYEIGVIGSPSVPDFSLMHNVGEQVDSWQDDSTVTLHYDELPPDEENPYPTPPNPPSPSPKPTYPTPSETGASLLTTTYNMTEANVQALGRFMWTDEGWSNKLKALNFSPIENIVGIKIMPVAITGTTSIVYIGNVKTNINGDIIKNTPIYTLGEVTITGRYQNFLDYAPYTSMLLFLPFVGFVELDPQFVTNKRLKVMYSFDLITGLCNAMLFVNDVYVESHQGNCGIDIPLVASNRAELEIGLATSLAQTAIGIASAPATGGSSSTVAVKAVSSAIGDLSSYATGFHTQRQGGYSPALAWTETRECFIVVETPNAAYPLTYEHDYGKPCMATYTISQLTGFTVCDQTVDVSGIGGATEEEKDMIRQLLTSGFYA